MKRISINDAFSFAIATLSKHAVLLLVPGMIMALFNLFFNFLKDGNYSSPLGLIILIIIVIVFIFLSLSIAIGYIRIGIKAYERKDVDLSWSIYNQFGKSIFGRFFFGRIVVGFFFVGGLILLIIPGFIFLMMYYFTEFILVEKHVSISESLEISNFLTKGIKWTLFGCLLFLCLIVVILFLPIYLLKPVIGFYYYPLEIILSPIISVFSTLTFVYIYKDISYQVDDLLLS